MLGPVSAITSDDVGLKLDVGYGDAEHVAVLIDKAAIHLFPVDPRQAFANETVCAVGVIHRVDGQLQMVIDKPIDLKVI
jgi:hypothetical protein